MRHAIGPQPLVRKTEIPFSIDNRTIVLVDDVLYTGRTTRAALDALIDFGRPEGDSAGRARRPRPPRAADQGRLRRQERADLAQGERAGAPAASSTARTKCWSRRGSRPWTPSSPPPPLSAQGPARHRRPQPPRRSCSILDTAEAMKEVGAARHQEGADAARPHRRQPVLRAEHAHAHLVRDRREAPQRRHAQHRDRHLERRQGRDAGRHRAEPRGDGARA